MESFKQKFMEDILLKDLAEATKDGYLRFVRYFFERNEPKKKA